MTFVVPASTKRADGAGWFCVPKITWLSIVLPIRYNPQPARQSSSMMPFAAASCAPGCRYTFTSPRGVDDWSFEAPMHTRPETVFVE